MPATLRTLKVTRYTSLSSEQSHTFGAGVYQVNIHALTQAVLLRLATGDATNYYTIDAGDELVLQNASFDAMTVFFIEVAASAAVEILEHSRKLL